MLIHYITAHTCIGGSNSKQINFLGLPVQLAVYVQVAQVRIDTKLSLGITLENRKFEVLVAARVRVCGGDLKEKCLRDNVLFDWSSVRYRVEYRGVIVVVLNSNGYFGSVSEERSARVTHLQENQNAM